MFQYCFIISFIHLPVIFYCIVASQGLFPVIKVNLQIILFLVSILFRDFLPLTLLDHLSGFFINFILFPFKFKLYLICHPKFKQFPCFLVIFFIYQTFFLLFQDFSILLFTNPMYIPDFFAIISLNLLVILFPISLSLLTLIALE